MLLLNDSIDYQLKDGSFTRSSLSTNLDVIKYLVPHDTNMLPSITIDFSNRTKAMLVTDTAVVGLKSLHELL